MLEEDEFFVLPPRDARLYEVALPFCSPSVNLLQKGLGFRVWGLEQDRKALPGNAAAVRTRDQINPFIGFIYLYYYNCPTSPKIPFR